MKASEYFDSRKRHSAALVEELAAHNASWPEVKAQFDALDAECIPLAAALAAARLAGSPTAISLEAELKLKRWARDNVKQRFSIKRDELLRQIENYTREPIQKFALECLDRARDLIKKYSFEVVEPCHNIFDGKRRRYTVKVSHNWACLDAAKSRILTGKREVEDMRHGTLSALEARIKELRAEFENFDFDTLEVAEVSEQSAKDMAPAKEDAGVMQKATLMPDGKLWVHNPPDSPRISQLKDRIEKLEKKI